MGASPSLSGICKCVFFVLQAHMLPCTELQQLQHLLPTIAQLLTRLLMHAFTAAAAYGAVASGAAAGSTAADMPHMPALTPARHSELPVGCLIGAQVFRV